ncbi:hypothetical protein HUN08_12410 [Gordonia sp. X0973]|uniref:hypothetical protein n=1 Tax=Gordonia sp. X0973 TaxID=2742602 RepID=UPI000F54A65C|nr:hypothetical protein [Gordonia sp. X0973]QKT07898.1 hypothetical protein HUN08_12410 [Gordonia sp. X0973]
MTAYDPFAVDTPEPEQAPEPAAPVGTTAVSVKPVLTDSGGKVVVTLKGGSGSEAPWIVIHADSVADATSQLDAEIVTLMEKTAGAAKKFQSLGFGGGGGQRSAAPSGGNSGGGRPARQEPPAGAPEAPGPDWSYKTGTKNGRTWHAWAPPGQGGKFVFFDL